MFKINEEIKLIAIDMDGTLLNGNNEVSAYTKKVIKKAQEEGIAIVLSTGRPLELCYEYHLELGLTTDLVTANGAQVWQADRTLLAEHTFDSAIAEELWQHGNDHNYYMWMVSTSEMFRNRSRPKNFHEYEWIKLGFGNLNSVQKAKVLEKVNQYSQLEITSSSPLNVEINPKGVNKAKGLELVCHRLGITFNNVLAIGDSLNDTSMFEAAQIGIAMDNAIPEIKNIADGMTDSNEEDGVAKVIDYLLKLNI